MDRIVQVGDVFVGAVSGRRMTVTEVAPTHATMNWECHNWKRPLTPEGTLVETGLYRFVSGAVTAKTHSELQAPEIRKDDRVQTQGVRARVGTVEAVLTDGMLAVFWDGGLKSLIRASDVKVVPPVAEQVQEPADGDLMPGDRVRFKFNKKCGTVVRKTGTPWSGEDPAGKYLIEWDHRPDRLTERREDLVVLYAPRDADAPLPAQKAIDEVDALRDQIKAEVERLQAELRKLKGVKNKLKGVELR